MHIVGKPLATFDYSDLDALVAEAVPEDMYIEYKASLPGESQNERREFLKDVSAFANRMGGAIFYGIAEGRDASGDSTGKPDCICGIGDVNRDQLVAMLDSRLRTGLEPSYTQARYYFIGEADSLVLVVEIPRSFCGPHMTKQEDFRFWIRTSNATSRMDVTELKRSFIDQGSLKRIAEQTREKRISEVWYGDSIPNLHREYGFFVHILRLGREDESVDLKEAANLVRSICRRPGEDVQATYHLDGVRASRTGSKCRRYAHLFRDGGLECFVAVPKEEVPVSDHKEDVLNGLAIEDAVVHFMLGYQNLCKAMAIEGPFVIMLSLLDCGGRYLFANSEWVRSGNESLPRFLDRNEVLMPPVQFDFADTDVKSVLRDCMNVVWQAAGWEECDPEVHKYRETVAMARYPNGLQNLR